MTGVLDRCVIRAYLLSQQFDQGFFMVWQSFWFYSHRWAYVSCIGIRYGFYCHQTRVTFVFSLVFWLFPSSYLLFCDLLHLNSSADQKPFLCLFFFGQMKCKTCIFFYYLKWKLLVDEYAMLRAIYVIWYITEKLYMVIQRLLTTLLIVIYYFPLSPYFNLLFKHSF